MEEEIKMKMESEKLNKKIRADKDQRRNERNEKLKSTKEKSRVKVHLRPFVRVEKLQVRIHILDLNASRGIDVGQDTVDTGHPLVLRSLVLRPLPALS